MSDLAQVKRKPKYKNSNRRETVVSGKIACGNFLARSLISNDYLQNNVDEMSASNRKIRTNVKNE